MMSNASLLSIKLFAQRHPGFTVAGLRHFLFHRYSNGLAESGAVLKCGRKLLIHEARFLAWIDARNDILEEVV